MRRSLLLKPLILLSAFLIGLSFSGCRQKSDRASSLEYPLVTSTSAAGAVHCFNGVQDGNENGVDCGGDCVPCHAATPSCSIGANSFQSNGGSATTITSPAVSAGTNSTYTFTGNTSLGILTITINRTPDITQSYPIDGMNYTANLNDPNQGSMDASGGTLYFNFANGKYSATLCGGAFYSFVTSLNFTVSANVKP
jgi:hypothetical protein